MQSAVEEPVAALSPRSHACHAIIQETVQQGFIGSEEALRKWEKWRRQPGYQEEFCAEMCEVLEELLADDEDDYPSSPLSQQKEQKRLELARDFLAAWDGAAQQQLALAEGQLIPAQSQETSHHTIEISDSSAELSTESQQQACKSLIAVLIETERITNEQGHQAWEAWNIDPDFQSRFRAKVVRTIQESESRDPSSQSTGERKFLKKAKAFLTARQSPVTSNISAHQQRITAQRSQQLAHLKRQCNELNGLIKHMTVMGKISAGKGVWSWNEWRRQPKYRLHFRTEVMEMVETMREGDPASRSSEQQALLEAAESFLATYESPVQQQQQQSSDAPQSQQQSQPQRSSSLSLPQPQSQACKALLKEMKVQRILTPESESKEWEKWKKNPDYRSIFVMKTFWMIDDLKEGNSKSESPKRQRLLKIAEGFLEYSYN